jgi:hypothetical protein
VAIPPYGVAIQEAVASGDLTKMKEAARQAEQNVRERGDAASALSMRRREHCDEG